MTTSYHLHNGQIPLLISMPHNGSEIPKDIESKMTSIGQSSVDTDWYKDKLYAFAKSLGAYIITPTYSRYVIDLNRDPDGVDLYPGANSTELCPTSSFDLSPLYLDGITLSQQEISARIVNYWRPYHNALEATLSEMKQRFGRAVLLEAHSIKSEVPRFFEGQLPDFNFGTSSGESCSPSLLTLIEEIDYSPYSQVSNGRFKGGYITRNYGNPKNNIHAVQLELSQRTYMDENALTYDQKKAQDVIPKLEKLVECLISFAKQ